MSEVDPGRTSSNSPGVGENWERMQAHEIAYQQLLANPPPLPVEFLPPLSPADFEQATQVAIERLRTTVLQTWDEVYKGRVGHIPDADFAAIFAAHEPLFVPGPTGPVPNPWVAQLAAISSRQLSDDLQRYARIMARHEA